MGNTKIPGKSSVPNKDITLPSGKEPSPPRVPNLTFKPPLKWPINPINPNLKLSIP